MSSSSPVRKTKRSRRRAKAAQPPSSETDQSKWDQLCRQISQRFQSQSLGSLQDMPGTAGAVYRWGFAAAQGGPVDQTTDALSQLAGKASPSAKRFADVPWQTHCELYLESLRDAHADRLSVCDAASAVVWAAALPSLSQVLHHQTWWDLVGGLLELREASLVRCDSHTPQRLLVSAEMGMLLAWQLEDVPSCGRLKKSAIQQWQEWADGGQTAVELAVESPHESRLAMASAIRCAALVAELSAAKLKKRQQAVLIDLATWVAGMTLHDGTTAFCDAARRDLVDDLRDGGLLAQCMKLDKEMLGPAISAALGKSKSGGRLAYLVSLPESMMHSEDAKVAYLIPEWDVRRGRVHMDYRSETVAIELFAGKSRVMAGDWQTTVSLDGAQQHPQGDWINTCEYTDDDVHYVEIEQPWTGGMVLQRQMMLVRDDRCVMMADVILPEHLGSGEIEDRGNAPEKPLGKIEYSCKLPLESSVELQVQDETREALLHDGKSRGLVFPLVASEWRVGPTDGALEPSPDGNAVFTARGQGALYAPLWLDFQSRRFKRKRTWRKLTVADELRLVDDQEAVGFRVQVGSEQWLIYRSLGEPRCRTVLGKHLIADFFCGRFDTGDGSVDELITVDTDADA
ncbi:MAG: hypothetical protein AAGA03_09340 [Planctomycetota bacterium]